MAIGLIVEIIGDSSKLASELGKADKDVSGFGAGLGGAAVKVAAVAGVAAVAATAIASMTSAAVEDAAQQERLMAAVAAAGAANGDYVATIDAAIAAGQDRAFSDDQTREALMSLVTATGDVDTATQELTAAQDLARFANVDLATAADAVAKAHAGQDGPLRKLLPGLAKGATATDTLADATARAAGQADTYADSAAGLQERGVDAFGELGETIGSAFLPVLDELLPIIVPLIKELGKLISAILPVLIPLLRIAAQVLGAVARVLITVVGWIVKLVDWLSTAIGKIGDFLDSINPLKGITLPSLPFTTSAGGGGAPAGVGRSAGAAGPYVAGPGPTINVYTTGDGIEAEQAVVRALRRVTRINGGVVSAIGWQG